MLKPFHLSIAVNSLKDMSYFFEEVLQAKIIHRDPSGYINVDFWGNQITLKEVPDFDCTMRDLHFGVNLNLAEFEKYTTHILNTEYENILTKPKIVEAGTTMERRKMFLKCPTGYLFEVKGYA